MVTPDLSRAAWRRSLRSQAQGNCVEVAMLDGITAIRDSKDPAGPVLLFSPGEWDAFLAGAKGGEFDRSP
jgi:hypothetical protein